MKSSVSYKKKFEFVFLVEFEECLLNVGASTSHDSQECTHVLVEELLSFDEPLIDAIVAEKPFVLTSWVEVKKCFICLLFLLWCQLLLLCSQFAPIL